MTTFQKLTKEIEEASKKLARAERDVSYAEDHEKKCRKELRELEASLKAVHFHEKDLAARLLAKAHELRLSGPEIDVCEMAAAGKPEPTCQGAESVRAIALHHGVL